MVQTHAARDRHELQNLCILNVRKSKLVPYGLKFSVLKIVEKLIYTICGNELKTNETTD